MSKAGYRLPKRCRGSLGSGMRTWNSHYEETMRGFAGLLGRPAQALTRPARDVNVIPAGPVDLTSRGIPPDVEALRRLCRETVGGTMARLGY